MDAIFRANEFDFLHIAMHVPRLHSFTRTPHDAVNIEVVCRLSIVSGRMDVRKGRVTSHAREPQHMCSKI